MVYWMFKRDKNASTKWHLTGLLRLWAKKKKSLDGDQLQGRKLPCVFLAAYRLNLSHGFVTFGQSQASCFPPSPLFVQSQANWLLAPATYLLYRRWVSIFSNSWQESQWVYFLKCQTIPRSSSKAIVTLFSKYLLSVATLSWFVCLSPSEVWLGSTGCSCCLGLTSWANTGGGGIPVCPSPAELGLALSGGSDWCMDTWEHHAALIAVYSNPLPL